MKIPIPYWGVVLQIIFILSITVFNYIRIIVMHQYSVYPVAFFELSIGLLSVLIGIYGLIKKNKPVLSFFNTSIGLLICFFFYVVYLLPEAGTPPPIPWIYTE
ncbi:hypothetical protein NQ095_05820 [Rossellomorea sp. SC111]|uniref:hypothetical protein n=1 Tax=Rossellomorea sp. SC111 TaxID=2968985 RepID=UPI00215A5FB3|nr:hypothetical protein [Rossellomorea sp. SC111]MCR8847917.1 hypothetical protein [Rossellomorea sp. SC111]